MSCAIYGMYMLFTLGACVVGTIIIIIDAGLPPGELSTDEPDDGGFFST